ncbi:MAG: TonB-dependent receptor [Sphingomonadales bacterium]|nr:TonB-dependent receptor [Sphingomonadales bacterium]
MLNRVPSELYPASASRGVKRLLSGASVLALGLMVSTPAFAQDTADTSAAEENADENEIIVTGIRARIESAQNIKREADTFVDAITAEDIGAFPDKSVNETLQRIPGVSINRFQGVDDPDHFSIEGANVVIRGLPFTRSEFNGRDAFSVNSGRSLGFNDIAPELLGSVLVYKNSTSDQIEGAISGLVNLRTRKPLDSRKLIIAGTIEANYGNVRKEITPSYSILASNVFETGIGDFGLQLSYSRGELESAAFGSALSDYRARPELTAAGDPTSYVPRSASVRQQTFDRDRKTIDGVLQWESLDGSAKVTAEYIRAEANQGWSERTFEGDIFDQGPQPNPGLGLPFTFDSNGLLLTGALDANGGIPININRRDQQRRNTNDDFSLNIELHPTERLSLTFDGQYSKATAQDTDVTVYGSIDQNIVPFIDRTAGSIPTITFSDASGNTDVLSDPDAVFYRSLLDHVEDSEGEELAFRADLDYEFDGGFLRNLKVGGRYSDRDQTRLYSGYTWGYLSQNWTGEGISPFSQTNSIGGIEGFGFPNFQRGGAPSPSNSLYSGGGINLAEIYRSGELRRLAESVERAGCCGGKEFLNERSNRVDTNGNGIIDDGDFYTPGDINYSREETWAGYIRADFGWDEPFGAGTSINGNVGVRYANTNFFTVGSISANPIQFDPTPLNGQVDQVPVTNANVAQFCAQVNANPPTNGRLPLVCRVTTAEQTRILNVLNAGSQESRIRNDYDYWLPSFNINMHWSDNLITRFAVSRAMSRPDFGRTLYSITLGQNDLSAGGTEPLFSTFSADPSARPVLSTNFDLGVEYYFNSAGGSVTFNAFYKKLDNLVGVGTTISPLTINGLTEDVLVSSFVNIGQATVKGFEVGYQQFYDFLPGPLAGFGLEANYTYIDGSGFPSQVAVGNFANPNDNPEVRYVGFSYPFEGLSKHAFNAGLLYEKYGISGRLAYSWRDRFLLTRRDVIRPNSPIFNEASGTLDGSLFYTINKNFKIGLQVSNILNEVVETSQVTAQFSGEYDASGQPINNVRGPDAPRSYFSNDTRYTFGLRFNF